MTPIPVPGLPATTLPTLLALLPSGIVYYTPVLDAAGEVVDFQFAYLNAAAQRLLNLPAQPTASYLQQWPVTAESGAFAFQRDAFRTGTPAQLDQVYPADGSNVRVRTHAARLEDGLLVTLTEDSEQARSTAEQALRDSQAREQAARAEAEAQQATLRHTFEQAPMAIAIFDGPAHRITFANAETALLWGRPLDQVVGRNHFEALPDLVGQGFEAMFADVYHTGQSYHLREHLVQVDRVGTGELVPGYFNIVYQPRRDAQARITGIIASATEVTEQVVARQRLEQLNEELELRVTARSAETRAALHAAEEQREQLRAQQVLLGQILGQVPAVIATLRGPQHRFSFFNAAYHQLTGGRGGVGDSVAEAMPEMVEQGFVALLDQVYASGQPYHGTEIAIMFAQPTGPATQHYFDFTYQPLNDAHGQRQGLLAFAVDVTAQVQARKQADTLQAAMLAVTQRQAAEREELYQVFEQAPVVIAQLRGPEHFFQYRNPAFQALFPGRVLTGRLYADALPEIVAAGRMPDLDRVYATGEPFYGTALPVVTTPPDGSAPHERYYDFGYHPYREQGITTGISVFAYDVTEQVLTRRQADTLQAGLLATTQRQAQHRQDLYQIFEQTPAAIVLLREPAHRIDYFNPAFEALFPPEEWTGRLHGHTLGEVYPRIRMAGLIGLLDRVFDTGEPQVVIEMPLAELQPGSPRYVTFAYQAYREEGRIVGVAAFVYDATEQVLARQEREAQQQELQRIFEQAPVAIAILRGPELVIELANAAVGLIWGREPAQVLGRPYFEALPDTAGQGFEAILVGVLQTGEAFSITEAPITLDRTHAGRPALGYVNFEFQPLYDEQARVSGVIAVGIEVTDQVLARQQVQTLNEALKATNQELADSNHRLTRTNTDLDTFVYTASHDLKAPISNIEGLLLALRQQLPPAALQADLVPRLLDMMQGSVARFQQTIGHLTDISQLQQTEAPETVDLAALIRGVRLDLAPLIEAAPATLSVTVDGCEAMRVVPKTLRSVVYNLLSNAVKYRSPERPAQVRLRAHCTAGGLLLAVQDNGLGLSEAQQGELFGMFRRLHTHVEGSGVGLFMVKRLVENAGGTITVESQPGVGSTFTVTLPA